jgi:primosomal protein N'
MSDTALDVRSLGTTAPVCATYAEVTELRSRHPEAVATALATPDLCLVQGLPGTGKSRVAAEVIARAARQGRRVLLLAPEPAALDRALELLADRPEVCAVRCLGRDEAEDALPPAAARCTFAA